MRELIAAIAGLGIFLYIIRNETASRGIPIRIIEGFEPEILQNTLNLIQEREPNIYPIDTIYFQKGDSGEGYIGRFMFMNTDGFFGVQYDVETDGNVLTSVSKTIPPEYESPFKGYIAREKYNNILNIVPPTVNMAKIHDNLKTENVAGFYNRKTVSA
jgi:hypothetical protein